MPVETPDTRTLSTYLGPTLESATLRVVGAYAAVSLAVATLTYLAL